MKAARAFTLIELLVVIAIIGVLAGLLLPVLSRAKHQASAAFCLSNLRQWGVATHLYAADSRDFLPPEGKPTPLESDLSDPGYSAWYVQLPEIIGLPRYAGMPWRTDPLVNPGRTAYLCPSNPRRCDASSRTNNLFHYCLNDYVNGTGADNRKIKFASLRGLSSLVWLYDSKNLPAVGQENFVHASLHNRGANFLFLDTHAARFKNADCWDFATNKGRTNNPNLVWIP